MMSMKEEGKISRVVDSWESRSASVNKILRMRSSGGQIKVVRVFCLMLIVKYNMKVNFILVKILKRARISITKPNV